MQLYKIRFPLQARLTAPVVLLQLKNCLQRKDLYYLRKFIWYFVVKTFFSQPVMDNSNSRLHLDNTHDAEYSMRGKSERVKAITERKRRKDLRLRRG